MKNSVFGTWRRVDIVGNDDSGEHIAFYPENGGDMFLRIVGYYKIHKAPHPRRRILREMDC
jgi:hypothetical protein